MISKSKNSNREIEIIVHGPRVGGARGLPSGSELESCCCCGAGFWIDPVGRRVTESAAGRPFHLLCDPCAISGISGLDLICDKPFLPSSRRDTDRLLILEHNYSVGGVLHRLHVAAPRSGVTWAVTSDPATIARITRSGVLPRAMPGV